MTRTKRLYGTVTPALNFHVSLGARLVALAMAFPTRALLASYKLKWTKTCLNGWPLILVAVPVMYETPAPGPAIACRFPTSTPDCLLAKTAVESAMQAATVRA